MLETDIQAEKKASDSAMSRLINSIASVQRQRPRDNHSILEKSSHLHGIVVPGDVHDFLVPDFHHPAILHIEVRSVLAHASLPVKLHACGISVHEDVFNDRFRPRLQPIVQTSDDLFQVDLLAFVFP